MDDELKHYGVLGMKWGKRRGRSSNVSATPKKQRRMSKKELQARVNRLRLEQEYAKLTAEPPKKSRVESLVKTCGTIAALTTSAVTIYNNMDKIAAIAKKASQSS